MKVLRALLIVPCVGLAMSAARAAEPAFVIPAPAVDQSAAPHSETIVLAGGCFWGVQAVFQHTKGVTSAISGYAGGEKQTAHYEMVGGGRTGHAESVAVTFDPQQISYGKILQIYFSVAHNPTELNRQGPDAGTQYRSAIFYANDEQKKIQAFTCNIVAPAMIQCVKVRRLDARLDLRQLRRRDRRHGSRGVASWLCRRAVLSHYQPRLRLLGSDRDARLRHRGERRLSAEGRHQDVGRRDHRRFPILEHDAERADGAWRARPVHGFANRRLGGQHSEHRGRASRRRRRRRHRHHRQQYDGHVRLR